MLYDIDKNWYHFIKEYLEWFSKFSFQEVAHPVGWPNRHISEILFACRHTLVSQNHGVSVRLHHWGNLLMTTSGFFIHQLLLIFVTHWTIRNKVFSILEHVLSQLSKVMNIINFAFGKLHFSVRKMTT